ncbi:class I tRNA ligase family protein [Candidatus Wolfebacteria bacterium]|nr:class I tRNA ligase family protein [Candidatus Wolfebacteria bacterium]
MFRKLKFFKPSEVEKKVLEFWQEKKIFEKSLKKKNFKGDFVFFDGPPFANGLPHYGHILGSIIKDVIPRYQTMKGKKVNRHWGWDCHGLPVEFEVEKELGLKTKKDIEKFGIGKFNKVARKNVLKYQNYWEKFIPKIGRWADMKNAYKTMDADYTESILWVFKSLYEKGLVYEGYKPMHICPRCETTLSNFEVTLNYKDIEDLGVTAKFELEDEPGVFVLAWTTTAWTLPGNVALAVNPKIDYVKIKRFTGLWDNKGKAVYDKVILAKEIYNKLKNDADSSKAEPFNFLCVNMPNSGEYEDTESPKILETFKGKELIGKKYKPLFDYYAKDKKLKNRVNGWKIYPADFVSIEEGVGIVHIAPAFGAEDMAVGEKYNLPFVQHILMNGKFGTEIDDFTDLSVKSINDNQSTDQKIIAWLEKENKIFKTEKIKHSYPHCWRCETPLLNYAASSWFVKVVELKNKIIKNNKQINWLPAHIKTGRFGKWLEDARDWAISRSRFWGAPLPVWKCEKCEKTKIIGSVKDIKNNNIEKSSNKYFIMRHGQAESNLFNIISSNYKNKHHLTEKGKKEVLDSLKKFNKKQKIDLIFSSDFVRTKETAQLAAKHFKIKKIIYDKRLREVNAGVFNNKNAKEYHSFFSSLEEKFYKKPLKGETLVEIKNRVSKFLYEIDKKYSNKNILIIGHEDPLWMMISGAQGANMEKSIRIKTNKPRVIKTGEIKKLDFSPLPHNENFELDFHRPYIDKIIFKCPKCQGKMKRVLDVFDCWFESGSMPYAQAHYPFNKSLPFPAEFIAEGLDQTRGWFYTLLVLSTALFDKPVYKNVIVNGIILAEDGQKMSKRLKNYPDPIELINKYGADALRIYLLSSPAVAAESLNFSEKGVDEIYKKTILRFWNVYKFYEMYTEKIFLTSDFHNSKNILDKWILARLEELKKEVSNYLDKYEINRAIAPINDFVDDLSTWYIRRSRERFKQGDKEAILTTKFVIEELCKIFAPFAPFISEAIYLSLEKNLKTSVHLKDWPKLDKKLTNNKLIDLMVQIREIVSLGLEARVKSGIKIRQPLSELKIKNNELKNKKELLQILAEEINVKKIVFDSKLREKVKLDIKITPELKIEGLIRELVRSVQDLRKKAGYHPKDIIYLWVKCPNKFEIAINKHLKDFKEKVGVKTVEFRQSDKFDAEIEMKIDGENIWLGIKKV